jgi:hypothetical protein
LEDGKFFTQEVQETSYPVRPGEPGGRPFWNKHAKRFLYAPAFNFPKVPGASRYKFTISTIEGEIHTFKADIPWAPLTPVWSEIPHGFASLKVEGLDKSEERVVGVAGRKDFYRAPVFNGPYHEPVAISYEDSGLKGLRALFLDSRFQYWLKEGKPDPEVFLNCFASKEMGASIRGMVTFFKIAKDTQEASDALKIAINIADFLIEHSEAEGNPFEYFPPVYWINPENKIKDWHFMVAKMNQDKLMLSEPVRAAFGYLDLYDAINEEKYLDAAIKIARTYVKAQREDGTWPLVVNRHTAEEIQSKALIPTWILFFFDRLRKQYKITEFGNLSENIFQWIVKHPVKDFHWDSQFEDVKIKEPYYKMAYEQAADTALYLLINYENDNEKIMLAEELLRFVEDQFVVWEKPNEGWKILEFPGGMNKYPQYSVDTWMPPAVIEQFGFVLVARATAVVMRVYAKAYKVTNKEVYLAKARSLANTLVVTQQFHGGGEIPSFPMSSKQITWKNNSVYTGIFLLEFGNQLASKKDFEFGVI